MFDNPQQALSLFSSILAFGLVLSLWLMGVILWVGHRMRLNAQIQHRLEYLRSASSIPTHGRTLRLWHDGEVSTMVVPGLSQVGLITRMERVRMAAGWEGSLGSVFVALSAILTIVGAAAFFLTDSFIIALLSMIAAMVLLWIYVAGRIDRRAVIFERQLVDALELAARSLRIGHPLIVSFRLIAEEIPAPVGRLFAEVCQRQALGVAMDQALRLVADESTNEDLKLFATSVVIQLSSGGNLADMMERLANVIRERQRLARRVKVLTTQTQFSKRVLLALPFLIFVVLNLINPNYMRPLYTSMTGQLIMLVAAMGMLLGWITMNWLSRLTF